MSPAPKGRRDRSRSRRPLARERIVATISKRGRFVVAEPLFERGGQIGLPSGSGPAGDGQMALIDARGGKPHVVRNLGSPERARAVVEALLWERLPERGFKRVVETEAAASVRSARFRGEGRRDLRELATFTVDPASARDFDDAVSAEPAGDGVRLWIHIADVSAHVTPRGVLDAEALRRATSVYVPGMVEPMLPEVLSADACSLVPGVERLAVTVEVELAPDGAPRSASFYRSLIRSDSRLDYDQLDELFAGRGRAAPEVAEPLELARRAAAALAERKSGGALEINSAEPDFEFGSDGEVVAARSVPQTESHRLIEQLMVLANERVADLCVERRIPTIYRVHEQPDTLRVEALIEKLVALGVPTPPIGEPGEISPNEAGALVSQASRLVAAEAKRRGHGREALTSLVLRSLKQAAYSDANIGHAGLGSPAYAHFTSPIRRYPDLVAHRALLSAVGGGEEQPEPSATREAAWISSEREREATKIERDADDVCACFLLGRELREGGWSRSFEGEVSGLVGAGAFVRFAGEHADVYEGFLAVRRMRDDHYDLNETETALVGRSGGALRLGDPVEVTVDSIEAPRGRVDLSPPGGREDSRPGDRGRAGGAARSSPPRSGGLPRSGPRKGRARGAGQRRGKGGRQSGGGSKGRH